MTAPSLSVVVTFHNMVREAARTLHTLSRGYQREIDDLAYEVIAIDSASTRPLPEADVCGMGDNFRYEYFQTASVSPVEAANRGVAHSTGEWVVVMVDGAHMLSPGVLAGFAAAGRAFGNPFIAAPPVHLGPGRQDRTAPAGYNQEQEDRLLGTIDWKADGYELFRVAGAPSDSSLGWFGCQFESNCFCLKRSAWQELGGFDARFQLRAGGLVNLDFFRRAVESPGLEYVLLLGEASFHQIHGWAPYPLREFHQEYESIRGRPYDRPRRRPVYLGSLSQQSLPLTRVSANAGLAWWEQNPRMNLTK
jgi:hypothetical protein